MIWKTGDVAESWPLHDDTGAEPHHVVQNYFEARSRQRTLLTPQRTSKLTYSGQLFQVGKPVSSYKCMHANIARKLSFKMITRFLTEVSTVFNPFSPKAKTARLFLSFLPPDARQTIKVTTKLLPRMSRDPSFVEVKFSKKPFKAAKRLANREAMLIDKQRTGNK